MQMSPASTQRSTGCRSHVDLIGYKVVCDVRNTSVFLRLSLVHCSFKEEILLSTYTLKRIKNTT